MTAETDLLDFAPCRCGTEDPMAIFVSRAGEPMQMRGELYVVCCRWCGENAPLAFVGIGAEELNQASIAAWNRCACVSSATEALRERMRAEDEAAEREIRHQHARAARLAEALREVRVIANQARVAYSGDHSSGTFRAIVAKIDAALEQETTNE